MSEYGFAYEPPEEKKEFAVGALVPLIAGIGVGAIILATQGQEDGIRLSGSAACRTDGTHRAQVHLQWTANTEDRDFDIIQNNTTVDTVRANDWLSLFIDPANQGVARTFKVIGVSTRLESNLITVNIPVCGDDTPEMEVAGLEVVFF